MWSQDSERDGHRVWTYYPEKDRIKNAMLYAEIVEDAHNFSWSVGRCFSRTSEEEEGGEVDRFRVSWPLAVAQKRAEDAYERML